MKKNNYEDLNKDLLETISVGRKYFEFLQSLINGDELNTMDYAGHLRRIGEHLISVSEDTVTEVKERKKSGV